MSLRHRARQLAKIALAATAVVAASGCGGDSAQADITIRVFPDGVPSFTGKTRNAALVAFLPDGLAAGSRDARPGERPGAARWIELTGTDGVYHATATGSHYVVAVGCSANLEDSWERFAPGLWLYYQTVFDTTDLAVRGCAAQEETVPVTMLLDGVPAEADTVVWLGSTVVGGSNPEPIEFPTPKGTIDVFATTYDYDPIRNVMVAIRGYRAPEPIELVGPYSLRIDYGALSLPFETHPLNVTGFDPADGVNVLSSYSTPHSRTQWPLIGQDTLGVFTTQSETTYAALDARMRRPDDVSNLRVLTERWSDGLTYDRYVRLAMKEPVAQSVALPPPLVVEAPAVASAANREATVRFPITPATLQTADYAATLSTTRFGPVDEPYVYQWSIFVQGGWANGASSVMITTPDLTALPGWTADMALIANADVDWSIRREDRTMPYDALPVDGRKILVSAVRGKIARHPPRWPSTQPRW